MPNHVRIGRIAITAVLACLLAQPLLAQVTIISNLDGNDLTQAADLDELRNKGMGFTMPAGQNHTLQHVTLRLETFGTVAPIVQLWSDAGGLPSAVIETLTNPTFAASGIANYNFTSAGTTLTAGTSYWIVAYGVAGAAQYNWKASSPAQTPTGIATHLGTFFDTNGPPPTGTSSILTSYSVTGVVVPVELMTFAVE
jgi:hypothetical protein